MAARISRRHGRTPSPINLLRKNRIVEVLDGVKERRARIASAIVDSVYASHEHLCESEIERLFLAGMANDLCEESVMIANHELIPDLHNCYVNPEDMAAKLAFHCARTVEYPVGVLMQVPIQGYRVDFAFLGIMPRSGSPDGWPAVRVIVECDGHDFHEKTKEQARRDKKRDRTLLANGFHVMRFTGSEIWQDAEACVKEVLGFIYSRLEGGA
jgi:very-short-patch-repair endonuclease